MSRSERVLHPDRSARDRFGYELRRLRKEHGYSLARLASKVHVSADLIQKIETAERKPGREISGQLDKVLQAGGALLECWERLSAESAARSVTAISQNQGRQAIPALDVIDNFHIGGVADSSRQEYEVEMERRDLLQSLAALGVGSVAAVGALDSIRRSFGRAFAQSDRDHLDDWENTVTEYGYSYFTTSPTALLPDLAADIVAVRSIAASSPADSLIYRGWCRIGGALSGLMAKSLSNLGNTRESRQWWNMAEHVADASGDIELSLWVRGERIIHGLYEHRPAQMLLRQVDSAMQFARGHNNCVGMAHLSTARAQALVLSGDYRSAEYELGKASEIVALLPSSASADSNSVMNWGEDRLHYTEAWVYSHMGNADRTAQAAERALVLYPASDDRTRTQIKLMVAFSLIKSGNLSDGIRYAHGVYGPLNPDQRTTMIGTLAGQVLRSIPAESRKHPDVAAYRALVTSPVNRAIES